MFSIIIYWSILVSVTMTHFIDWTKLDMNKMHTWMKMKIADIFDTIFDVCTCDATHGCDRRESGTKNWTSWSASSASAATAPVSCRKSDPSSACPTRASTCSPARWPSRWLSPAFARPTLWSVSPLPTFSFDVGWWSGSWNPGRYLSVFCVAIGMIFENEKHP